MATRTMQRGRTPEGVTAAAKSNPVLSWLARRHSFPVEVLVLVVTYIAYDAARGLVRGGPAVAVIHARSIANLERSVGLLHEVDVQRALAHLPGITTLLSFGYDVLHLSVTGGVLVWLYFRHRDAYPRVRSTLLAATCVALVGFTLYPSAPPRLAGIGIADTLSLAKETANSGVLQFLYNPYAAMPSLHMAYAAIAGACLYHWGSHRFVRCIGIAYPVFVAVEVVATGNHFFVDLVAGVGVDACAFFLVSRLLTERSPLGLGGDLRWADHRSTVTSGLAEVSGAATAERRARRRCRRHQRLAQTIREPVEVGQGNSTS